MDMKFNKKEFEFYTSDDSCVQAYQIEGSDVWFLEIFPPNQTQESFEACEFSGSIKFYKEPIQFLPFSKPENHQWSIERYPAEWDEKLYQEFCDSLEEELNRIQIIE